MGTTLDGPLTVAGSTTMSSLSATSLTLTSAFTFTNLSLTSLSIGETVASSISGSGDGTTAMSVSISGTGTGTTALLLTGNPGYNSLSVTGNAVITGSVSFGTSTQLSEFTAGSNTFLKITDGFVTYQFGTSSIMRLGGDFNMNNSTVTNISITHSSGDIVVNGYMKSANATFPNITSTGDLTKNLLIETDSSSPNFGVIYIES